MFSVRVTRNHIEFAFVAALIALPDEYRLANEMAVELQPFGGQVLKMI
jgi:hypothetical protein